MEDPWVTHGPIGTPMGQINTLQGDPWVTHGYSIGVYS